MNIQAIKKLGKQGALCLLCISGTSTFYSMADTPSNDTPSNNTPTPSDSAPGNSTPNTNIPIQTVQTLTAMLADAKYAAMEPAQKLVYILTVFFCELNIKGHFTQFVATLIAFLQDPGNVEALKKKFPTINIAAVIATLKKVQNDKAAATVVWKLRNYMNLFPEELKKLFSQELRDMGSLDFTQRISKRLMDK